MRKDFYILPPAGHQIPTTNQEEQSWHEHQEANKKPLNFAWRCMNGCGIMEKIPEINMNGQGNMSGEPLDGIITAFAVCLQNLNVLNAVP